MTDRTITCQRCGAEFVFTVRDQLFYAEKGFQDPKNCKACREAIKAQRAQREQAPASVVEEVAENETAEEIND